MYDGTDAHNRANSNLIIQNIRNAMVIIRKCPSKDKYKLMNTEGKKMYGNDKEMPNLRSKTRPLSPGFPDLCGAP